MLSAEKRAVALKYFMQKESLVNISELYQESSEDHVAPFQRQCIASWVSTRVAKERGYFTASSVTDIIYDFH